MEKQKEYNLRYLLAKLHEEKRRTGSDSGRTNAKNRVGRLPTS
jgi:hypothetical protein